MQRCPMVGIQCLPDWESIYTQHHTHIVRDAFSPNTHTEKAAAQTRFSSGITELSFQEKARWHVCVAMPHCHSEVSPQSPRSAA